MQTLYLVLIVLLVMAAIKTRAATPFPRLLPDAGSFELTVREDPSSLLPPGPACAGEAGLTLACRAFVVTLKNVGSQTVRLSRLACEEPAITFEIKTLSSSNGWWPISRVSNPRCTPSLYENLRLRPGEATEYKTRLISKNRPADLGVSLDPGLYTLRANWWLWGCTEKPEGTDCLTPLQVVHPSSADGYTFAEVDHQTPVEIVSNEIEVNSPVLPDLGPLKLGFQISVAPEPQGAETRRKRFQAPCTTDLGTSLECTVFHYMIRNLGDRPIRNGRYTCSDFSIMPEYRIDGEGEWKQLKSQLDACTMNLYVETPILPGKTADGDFILRWLALRFDTSPLYPAGKYDIRFTFHSSACWASSDGSFCIQRPAKQATEMSNVVTINATAFTPSGPSVK